MSITLSDKKCSLLLIRKVQEFRIEEAWKRFEDAGFKPILVKGWAAAQNYPNPEDRTYNDIDLLIEESQFAAAVNLAESFETKLGIDLHKNAKTLDILPFNELFVKSKIINCGETPVRVLSAEDHLRLLAVHWLTDGGAKKDKLWDIYYAVQNRPNDFDWNRCLNSAGKVRRQWIICAIGLAKKYLNLNVEDTPIAFEVENLPTWLIKAVEDEWKSSIKLRPLIYCLKNKRELYDQIKKRIPPNPIQATVQMEGRFDDASRLPYQIGNVFRRFCEMVDDILEKKKKGKFRL